MFDSFQWILLNIFYAKSVLHSLDMENDTLRISRKLCSSLISIFCLIFPLTVKTERLIKCLPVWLGWVWLGLCTEYEESDWRIQWLCWVWLVFNDYAESTWQILWISWVWLVVFNEYAGSDSALMNTIGPNRCTTKSLKITTFSEETKSDDVYSGIYLRIWMEFLSRKVHLLEYEFILFISYIYFINYLWIYIFFRCSSFL